MKKIIESVAERMLSYMDTREKRQKAIINIGRYTIVAGIIVILILVYAIMNK